MPFDRVVADDALEVLGALPADGAREIGGVTGQDAGPDHVDLHRVDVAGLRRQQLLVLREALRGGFGTGDARHLHAGRLAELGDGCLFPRHDRAVGAEDDRNRRAGQISRQALRDDDRRAHLGALGERDVRLRRQHHADQRRAQPESGGALHDVAASQVSGEAFGEEAGDGGFILVAHVAISFGAD